MPLSFDTPSLLLHLGYPKSGTTTLQGGVFPLCNEIFFAGKRAVPGEKRIWAEADRFRHMICYGTHSHQTDQGPEIREGMERIWTESGKERMLLSFESMTNPFVDIAYTIPRDNFRKAGDIAAMLAPWREAGVEFRVLVTIRSQRALIPSLFSQIYLQGFSTGLFKSDYDSFLDFMLEDRLTGYGPDFRFDEYLDHLGMLFGSGNVIATTMSDVPAASEAVARFLGLTQDKCRSLIENAPVRNVRNRKKGRHMMARSAAVDLFEANTGIALRRKAFSLKDRLNLRLGKPVMWEVPDRSERIEAYYKASNARLADKYGIIL